MSPHRIGKKFQQKTPKFPQKSLFKITDISSFKFDHVGSKLKCSYIAAETLETLPGTNDINSQMQIRSIISAPVLHPTIAPPPVSAFSNGDLGARLITIVDLHNEVTELATNIVNDGSIVQFMLPQGILDQVDNDGKIILLTRKRDYLKTLLERKLQKLQEAPS